VVDLCVPNHLHRPITEAAAAAGKHVICTKPLTAFDGPGDVGRGEMLQAALESARAMVDATRRAGVNLMYGENWVEAHVPLEIPSSEESEERLRWFEFYGKPGGDRIYVVLTREPLPIVPTDDALVSFCGLNKDKCPWQPPADVWQLIEKATKAEVKVATSKNFGQTQTETEKVATTRGLGLDKSAAQPAVIRMSASTNEPVLVTILDLVHK